MKLEDARDAYEGNSSTASQIVRQLALAGVALIWIFRVGGGEAPQSAASAPVRVALDTELKHGVLFIIVALFLDLLQYIVGTFVWFAVFAFQESKGLREGSNFGASPKLNWPTWALFWMKIAALMIAYLMYILPFLVTHVSG